ncbi:MAG: hypothetical protein R2861_16230 [Desulfobacterales bacterium]
MKCPFCGCQKFYIKDMDDEFETYGFDCTSGDVCFDPEIDTSDIPDVCDDSTSTVKNARGTENLRKQKIRD